MRILRFAWLKTNSPNRHRRPYLELLERRCLPSTVTNLADAGPGSLRDAISTTSAGGTVDFQPGLSGTITLTSATLVISKDLTIMGPGTDVITGANLITVSGNDLFQVFRIAPSATVTISSLTIANGRAQQGVFGGGIDNEGTLTVSFITISGNSAYRSGGGAIYNSTSGKLAASFTTLAGNGVSGGEGGGIYNDGMLTLSNYCTLSGNNASQGRGSGIFNSSSGTLTVSNSTLSGNGNRASDSNGGGIYNDGKLTVDSSMFSGNTVFSGDPGGGIFT